MARRPTKDVEQFGLPSSGTIRQSQVIAEFGGANNLRDYLGAASGVPTSGNLKLTDFYGTSASDAVDYWPFHGGDYIIGAPNGYSPGDRSGVNRSRSPWNSTGAAFDKTDATRGSSSYNAAIGYTEYGTGGGSIRNSTTTSGFNGPINSQYPNDPSNVAYCEAVYPFQKLKAGTYRMTGTTTAYNGAGRYAEIYLYVICFANWSMSGGIGYATTPYGSNGVWRQQVLGGRNVSNQSQSGSFTVPEGYEYVCLECRNANNVYQAGSGSRIVSVVATKTARLGEREDTDGDMGDVQIIPPFAETVPYFEPSPPEEPLPPDAVLGTMEIEE